MARFTSEQLDERLKSNAALRKRNPHLNSTGSQGIGPYTGNQEQHVQHRAERKPRVEKALRKTFRVTVTLRFADLRTRDPDAALSTLLDCIIAARRQLEGDTGNHRQITEGTAGE